MLATVDLRGTQTESSDPVLLNAYLQQLVGEPFLQCRFSYGDELTLHFGQPREPRSKKLIHRVVGSFTLGARASGWYLKTAAIPAVYAARTPSERDVPDGFTPITPRQLEQRALAIPGSKVILAEAIVHQDAAGETSGFGCSLLLSDGTACLIIPDRTDGSDAANGLPPIADWELFTPFDRYLRVGPGAGWSYLPSRPSSSPRATEPCPPA